VGLRRLRQQEARQKLGGAGHGQGGIGIALGQDLARGAFQENEGLGVGGGEGQFIPIRSRRRGQAGGKLRGPGRACRDHVAAVGLVRRYFLGQGRQGPRRQNAGENQQDGRNHGRQAAGPRQRQYQPSSISSSRRFRNNSICPGCRWASPKKLPASRPASSTKYQVG